MDFTLFFGVVKRYKRVVIPGAVLAVVLAVLSYGTPGLKGGKPTIVPGVPSCGRAPARSWSRNPASPTGGLRRR